MTTCALISNDQLFGSQSETPVPSCIVNALLQGLRPFLVDFGSVSSSINQTPFGLAIESLSSTIVERQVALALQHLREIKPFVPSFDSIDMQNTDVVVVGLLHNAGIVCSAQTFLLDKNRQFLIHVASSIENKELDVATKTLAFDILKVKSFERIFGITTFDDPFLNRLANKFASLEMCAPLVSPDPAFCRTLVYEAQSHSCDSRANEPVHPTFWLNAENLGARQAMQDNLNKKTRYFLKAPFSEVRGNKVFLPVVVREFWWGGTPEGIVL